MTSAPRLRCGGAIPIPLGSAGPGGGRRARGGRRSEMGVVHRSPAMGSGRRTAGEIAANRNPGPRPIGIGRSSGASRKGRCCRPAPQPASASATAARAATAQSLTTSGRNFSRGTERTILAAPWLLRSPGAAHASGGSAQRLRGRRPPRGASAAPSVRCRRSGPGSAPGPPSEPPAPVVSGRRVRSGRCPSPSWRCSPVAWPSSSG